MAKDITNKRFGRLVAKEKTDKRDGSSIVWKCICDCGKEKRVSVSRLSSGSTKSCGCLRRCSIEAGQIIGRFKINKELESRTKKGLILFECICQECNEEKILSSRQLGDESTLKPCIVGKKFGKLKVLSYSHTKDNRKYWKCICECGKTHKVFTSNLTTGRVQSCGCLKYNPRKNIYSVYKGKK